MDARGHITRGRAPKGTRSLPSRNPAGWGGKDPVRNPITQHEHPQVAMKRGRWNREEGERRKHNNNNNNNELRAYTGLPLLIVRSGQPAVQAWAPEYTGMRHVQAAARARRRATRHGIRHEPCSMRLLSPT